MKKILLFAILTIVFSCSSAPRYHYKPPPTTQKRSKSGPPTLLKPGVQHTAIFTASFYGHEDGFDGRPTATGEKFDKNKLTAAHKSLPFGTVLKVTFGKTGKSVLVTINDRGPYVPGRDIDLSYGAALQLGLIKYGVGKVRVTVVKWGSGG